MGETHVFPLRKIDQGLVKKVSMREHFKNQTTYNRTIPDLIAFRNIFRSCAQPPIIIASVASRNRAINAFSQWAASPPIGLKFILLSWVDLTSDSIHCKVIFNNCILSCINRSRTYGVQRKCLTLTLKNWHCPKKCKRWM